MNRRRFFTVILIALLLSACGLRIIRGSGDRVTESRRVSDFDRVSLTGSGELVITQSGEESLTVEADENIMQYVRTEVRGGTLELGFVRGVSVSTRRPIRFDLSVRDLDDLNISGSGTIDSDSIDTSRLKIGISGSGDVRIDSLTARTVDVRIGGSGGVRLAGEADEQEVVIAGSGGFRGGDLRGEIVQVKITGSGNATVWATESLDVRITGSGSVNYYGNPRTSFSGAGSGRIKSLDD